MASLESLSFRQLDQDMENSNTWYFAGKPVVGSKYIALGRRDWYTGFANRLTRELGTKVYLCDFMDWVDESRPEKSLYFFIETSERIDVNLKGIPKEDLQRATVGARISVYNREMLRVPYMTGWEINQLFYKGHRIKTYWHTSGSMSAEEAYNAMGRKVPITNILDASLSNEEYLGSVKMPIELILQKYKQEEISPLEKLLRTIAATSWSSKLEFCDSYGTLIIVVHGPMNSQYTGMLEISVHHDEIFIVQVYDSSNHVLFWDRNVDMQSIGRRLIGLIRKG